MVLLLFVGVHFMTSLLGQAEYNLNESQQYIWQSLHASHREKLLQEKEECTPQEELSESLSFSRLSDSFLGSASRSSLSDSTIRIRGFKRSAF